MLYVFVGPTRGQIGLLSHALLRQILQLPSAIAMTIAATWMYRSLTDFTSEPTDRWDSLQSFLPRSYGGRYRFDASNSMQITSLTQTPAVFHLPFDLKDKVEMA